MKLSGLWAGILNDVVFLQLAERLSHSCSKNVLTKLKSLGGRGKQRINKVAQNAEMEPGRGGRHWYCLISIFSYSTKVEVETERSTSVI